jgi:hypothetical protein
MEVRRENIDKQYQDDEVPQDSSLVRLLMKGFTFRLRCELMTSALPLVRGMIIDTIKLMAKRIDALDDRIPAFILMSLKGLHMRLKLNMCDADEMLKGLLSSVGMRIPDIIDLIDTIGHLMNNSPMLDSYDNMPFLARLIDTINDVGIANIEFGITGKLFTASCQIKTEGVKDVFDMIMTGMHDV